MDFLIVSVSVRWNITKYKIQWVVVIHPHSDLQSALNLERSSHPEVLLGHLWNHTSVGMSVLLKICCIFSEHLFLRTILVGCFWLSLMLSIWICSPWIIDWNSISGFKDIAVFFIYLAKTVKLLIAAFNRFQYLT